MHVVVITELDKLKELAAEAEKPENHIKTENIATMSTAFDSERFTRTIGVVDPINGSHTVKVAFTITEGELNGVRKLFRHASLQVRDAKGLVRTEGLNSLMLLLTLLEALGFREDDGDLIRQSHPYLPGVVAYFQEFEEKT